MAEIKDQIKEEKPKTPRKPKAPKPSTVVEEPVTSEDLLKGADILNDEAQKLLDDAAKLADTPLEEVTGEEEIAGESEEKVGDSLEGVPDKGESSLEEGPDEGGELGAAASQPAEEAPKAVITDFSKEEDKAPAEGPSLDEEPEIVSGPAEIAQLNPNLPADRSKWVARLVAEQGYHILYKGSLAKAYKVADNYNRMHGFPADKVRRIRH